MSRISAGLAGDNAAPAVGASALGTQLTITYTTDDPGTSPNGAATIADGDATLVTAEIVAFIDEVEFSLNTLATRVDLLRTALIALGARAANS
jgi:hypothetical protein